jgi:riboflavin kinase, archaea type
MTVLEGTVISGVGSFSYWMDKLQEHYTRKTGMQLVPGTLNLRLEQPYSLPKRGLRLEAEEYGGAVSVNIVPCSILGRRAFLLRTDANEQGLGHHPKTVIEIATDVKLREAFQLEDGDRVKVYVLDDSPDKGSENLP